MTGTEQGAHDSTSGRGYINKASGYGPTAFKVAELVSNTNKAGDDEYPLSDKFELISFIKYSQLSSLNEILKPLNNY